MIMCTKIFYFGRSCDRTESTQQKQQQSSVDSMRLEKLASKSKQQYENVYFRFMDWRKENNITTFTEEDMISYFTMLADKLKYSSMFTVYSMLRTTLQAKEKVDIGWYKNMVTFIKEQSKYAIPRKDKLAGFTAEQILEFVNNAPDKTYLLPKVVLIIGVTASLGRDDLKELTIDDVEETNNSIIINIRNEKYTICGPFYNVCKKYLALRPSMGYDKSFFLNYQPGKNTRKYQPIGKNRISGYAQEVAKYLKLPNIKSYNGKSFRRTAMVLGLDSKGNLVPTLRKWVRVPQNKESGNVDSEEDSTPFEFCSISNIKLEKLD